MNLSQVNSYENHLECEMKRDVPLIQATIMFALLICTLIDVCIAQMQMRMFAAENNVAVAINGLEYAYFEFDGGLDSQTPIKTGTLTNFGLTQRQREENYAFRFTGYIDIPKTGEYTFYIHADFDTRLQIGEQQIAARGGGDHTSPEAVGTAMLAEGLHPLLVEYLHGSTPVAMLEISWQGPDIAKVQIPPERLYRDPSGMTVNLPPTPTPTETPIVTPTYTPTPQSVAPQTPTPQRPQMPPVFGAVTDLYLPIVSGGSGDFSNARPQVTLVMPTDGLTYTEGNVISISADASDDEAVKAVYFYANGFRISLDTTAPYRLDWNDAAPGSYIVTARVVDNDNASSTSQGMMITVNASPGNAPRISFAEPLDGATVTETVQLKMVPENFIIEPAGSVSENAGHFHVMVDVPCVTPGKTIPFTSPYRHFGNGNLEATIELTPGQHTLCLQAGTGFHEALALTDMVTITVSAGSSGPSIFFTEPAEGATVTETVTFHMDAQNFIIEPAGIVQEGVGHLHLMLDTDCIAPGDTIPRDGQHIHLGNGQQEISLDLAVGQHTACLQAGNGAHQALTLTQVISFTVISGS